MKKFEYKTVNQRLTDSELNALGMHGYELATHSAIASGGILKQYYVFKREIIENKL